MSKICSSCGTMMDDNIKFCPMCGTKSEVIIDVVEETSVVETPVVDTPFMEEAPSMGEIPDPVFSSSQETYNYNVPEMNNQSKVLAIISLVTGILSILCCCCGWFGILLALTAVVTGVISIVNKKGGFGMAVAGISCGGVALFISIFILIIGTTSTNVLDNFSDNYFEFVEDMVDDLTDYL